MSLVVTDLEAWYGPAHILSGVSLEVHPGEVAALLGRNGAGKSTTCRAIMGLVPRRAGRVVLVGQDISTWPPHAIARLGLGYVPEDRRIFTDLTVEENLVVGEQAAAGRAVRWTRELLFELFPNLADMRNRRGGEMSGGEQQMLALARTLIGQPGTVLLDEPSEGLAPRIVEQMAQAIQVMKRDGVGLLLSEQSLPFAAAVADRAFVIEKGQIRFSGPMRDVLDNPSIRDAYLSV